jgi:hypothetical protein
VKDPNGCGWLNSSGFFAALRMTAETCNGKGNNNVNGATATGNGNGQRQRATAFVLVGDLVEVAEAAGDDEGEDEDGCVVADVDEGGGHDGAETEADVAEDERDREKK